MLPDAIPSDPELLKRMLLEQLTRAEELRATAEELRASRDELASLHAEAVASRDELAARHAEAVASRDELAARHAELLTELARLKHRMFGRRHERVSDDQIQLFNENDDPAAALEALQAPAPAPAAAPGAAPARRQRRGGGGGRRAFPEHLPRVLITNQNPGPTSCDGCGGPLKVIGEDRSERIDLVPAQVRVLVSVRQKRACPCCPARGVITQPPPPFALEKAAVGDSLLSRMITDKFAYHIPLHRQAKRLLRDHGIHIAISTMCGWMAQTADLLKHVTSAMRVELLASPFLQSDATGLPILHGPENAPLRGHLWSYTDGVQAYFCATTDGRQVHPLAMLEGFQGTLLTDGAGAYNAIAERDGVTRAGCWAHARRKFFEALDEDPVRAGIALSTIREIFLTERRAHELDIEARARFRHDQLAERLARFRTLLDSWSTTCRPKSGMGKAITYARSQWDTLLVFLRDGATPPDNNLSERLLRAPVVGRKNWLFAGSMGGAQAAATLFTIVVSCEMVGIDPFAYLRDVLSLLPNATPAMLRTLTPRAWAAAFAEPAA